MSLEPRSGETIDPTAVFDKGCAGTRVKELTLLFIAKFAMDDMERIADAQRRAFKPITPEPHSQDSNVLEEKFGEQARKEALKILEAEKKAVVEFRAENIKKTFNTIIRQLRLLVFTDKGKGKIYMKKVPIEGFVGQNAPHEREIDYFETFPEGIDRNEQIARTLNAISEFNDYLPYMPQDLQDLYREILDLRPERVRAEKENAEKKET